MANRGALSAIGRKIPDETEKWNLTDGVKEKTASVM
jgi:hypothetical protein